MMIIVKVVGFYFFPTLTLFPYLQTSNFFLICSNIIEHRSDLVIFLKQKNINTLKNLVVVKC